MRGKTVTCTASGSVNGATGGWAFGPWDANGAVGNFDPTAEDPTSPAFALVGRVGPAGAPFLLGKNYTGSPGSSGSLYLVVNDSIHSDNSGSFIVQIHHEAIWIDTGVDVLGSVAITATGTVTGATGGWAHGPWGPDGIPGATDPSAPVPGSQLCAVVGKIAISGSPFPIGSSYSGSPGAGRLYLSINDGGLADNGGSFSVVITQ